jgi:myosin heavy subunit
VWLPEPVGSDAQLLAKLHETCARSPAWRKVDPRRKQTEFVLAHYAGEVPYSIAGFLGRNRAVLSPDLLTVMETSKVRA